MKLDKTQPLYILYGCNIVKERSTMRLVAATTDEEMLKVIIGAQILLGVMDYRGFSNMKGFQQFRAACRNGDERPVLRICGENGKSAAARLCQRTTVRKSL